MKKRLLPDLDGTEWLMLCATIAIFALIIFDGMSRKSLKEQCKERGGIYIENTCIDEEAVIVLRKK